MRYDYFTEAQRINWVSGVVAGLTNKSIAVQKNIRSFTVD